MTASRWVLLGLSALSALLVTLALPGFDLGAVAWVGLVPLVFAIRHAGMSGAAGLGWLFGLGYAGGAFYWLGGIDTMTPLTTGIMYAGFAAYYLAFGLLYRLLCPAVGGWMLVAAPALWVAVEYARSSLSFLALPWNLLAHTQYRYLPVIQVADLTGVYGISFLVVMVGQLLSELPDVVRRRPGSTPAPRWLGRAALTALVLALTLAYGWWRLAEPAGGERLRVAVVQANALARNNMPAAEQVEHLRAYDTLTREVARQQPELIVWPSSSLPGPIQLPFIRYTVVRLAREAGVHLLVGGAGGDKLAPTRNGFLPFSNSEFLFAPTGLPQGQYNKTRLTPFTEYVPLRGTVPWPRWLTTLKDSFVPGTEYTLFRLPRARFGAPICWENTFPDVFRRFVRDGAQFMVSVTNEGFFGRTSAPYQTLAMNVFRAVENRVAVVRAATTGVSAVIEPNGRISGRITGPDGQDTFVAGFLVRDVPLARARTFYTLYGDVFAYAAVAVSVLMLLLTLRASMVNHRVRS